MKTEQSYFKRDDVQTTLGESGSARDVNHQKYEAPKLESLGDLRELIRGGSGADVDGQGPDTEGN